VPDELTGVLDSAIYKEVVSQAVYEAAQQKTDDPADKELLKELAGQEVKHTEKLKELKEKGLVKPRWHQDKIADLKISNALVWRVRNSGIKCAWRFSATRLFYESD